MTLSERVLTLFLILAAFAVPAHANNPPQPDGLFSVLLIFPIVIFARRVAGIAPKTKSLSTKAFVGVAVGVISVVFLGAGTFLGASCALIILVYALIRGSEILRQGLGPKRFFSGFGVMVFALFAFLDYFASVASYHKSADLYEYVAAMRIRQMRDAEQQFSIGQRKSSGRTTFGTIKDLETAGLIKNTYTDGHSVEGYSFGEILDADKGHFIIYATPAPELKVAEANPELVPGASLFKVLFDRKESNGTGRYSFAADETGQIRRTIRNTKKPLTREEFAQWTAFQ